jgi:hypothetical protein
MSYLPEPKIGPTKSVRSAFKGTRDSLRIKKPLQNLRINEIFRTPSEKTYSITEYGIPSENKKNMRRSRLGPSSVEGLVGADQPIQEVGRGVFTKIGDEFVNSLGEPTSPYFEEVARNTQGLRSTEYNSIRDRGTAANMFNIYADKPNPELVASYTDKTIPIVDEPFPSANYVDPHRLKGSWVGDEDILGGRFSRKLKRKTRKSHKKSKSHKKTKHHKKHNMNHSRKRRHSQKKH